MSIIDSLKKKINGIAYGDLTKEIYDSFISVLNNSDGLNTGKENGVAFLIKNSMFKDNIIAFGNGINDISLFTWATKGVAVKNSCQSLKKVADIILLGDLYRFINNM